MTITPNPPSPGIQQPTIDVTGRVFYKPGPWGSKHPVRSMRLTFSVTDTSGVIRSVGLAFGDIDGRFKIDSGLIPFSFRQVALEVHEDFADDSFSFVIVPGWVAPSQGRQDLGELIFPFEPEHPELAWVNSVPYKDTQNLVRTLSRILRSNDRHVAIDLLSEWRGTVPAIPVDKPDDEARAYVSSKNGHTFKKPVPLNIPEDVRARDRENARIMRKSQQMFAKPIPILTPAQKLMKILSGTGFAKDFPQRVVKEIYLHGIVSGKAGQTVDAIAAALERLSTTTITELESGNLLRRLVTAIQRAAHERFHFDTFPEEAAADMSAACSVIFLAGFMAKNSAVPKISYNYWYRFDRGPMDENRDYVKITISAGN